ncbi:hypothetical protein BamMEX5DRAFT_6519 [Burkholderia ambifaria MEX-5]|uniref:Transposase IS116/IS110/IS902 family protein n=1 Tax=Burkholderia ambifaria MEX-5 TaxID=396597 RepID=B1TFF3_9BURK|nr:hypothetical protein BamMEX5DRAFT_6519 [Burkholderia ambifaria MEX-5]
MALPRFHGQYVMRQRVGFPIRQEYSSRSTRQFDATGALTVAIGSVDGRHFDLQCPVGLRPSAGRVSSPEPIREMYPPACRAALKTIAKRDADALCLNGIRLLPSAGRCPGHPALRLIHPLVSIHPDAATRCSSAPCSYPPSRLARSCLAGLLRAQIQQRKRHNQALIALARRRCDILFAMLRDGTIYQPKSAPNLTVSVNQSLALNKTDIARGGARWNQPRGAARAGDPRGT